MKKQLHKFLMFTVVAIGAFIVLANHKVAGQSSPSYEYFSDFSGPREQCLCDTCD